MTTTNSAPTQPARSEAGPGTVRTIAVYPPLTDIWETPEALHVVAEMPGVDPESVQVSFERSTLRLAGRNRLSPPSGLSLLHSEVRLGDWERSFSVGIEVDVDRIEASVKEGLLRVVLPKATPRSHRITVRVD